MRPKEIIVMTIQTLTFGRIGKNILCYIMHISIIHKESHALKLETQI